MRIEWNGRTYEYDDAAVTVSQAQILKNETGIKWPAEFFDLLKETDPTAVQALMWLVRTQSGEQLRIADCDGSIVQFLEAYAKAAQDQLGDEEDPTLPVTAGDSPVTSPDTVTGTS